MYEEQQYDDEERNERGSGDQASQLVRTSPQQPRLGVSAASLGTDELTHPVLNVLLHLTGELLLVPSQPVQGVVRPAVVLLVDQPGGRLGDGEDEDGHHDLDTEEEPGADLPVDVGPECVGGKDPGGDDDNAAGGQRS